MRARRWLRNRKQEAHPREFRDNSHDQFNKKNLKNLTITSDSEFSLWKMKRLNRSKDGVLPSR